jgi:bifunctional oligoribonuclease and PAP phosphatase NrnA
LSPQDVHFELNQVEEFKARLHSATAVLIGTHLNPDGDALGSALALSHYLWSEGIKNEVLCHHAAPYNLQFLPEVGRVRSEPVLEGHDLAVMLDLNNFERLGKVGPYFEAIKPLVLVDHHVPSENDPGDIRFVDVQAPATAVLLARLFRQMDVAISPAMATCLLTGIVTDTGSFRFRNTSAESLEIGAHLLECGADINRVSEEVFGRKPLSGLRLLGVMLETMQLELDERLVYGVLPHSAFRETGANDEETEGFVNEMLSVRTVEIAALFRETKPGWVRVSLRSRGDYDVAAVAREVGGGGHRNAAGCSFESTPEEAVNDLIPRLRACLASS